MSLYLKYRPTAWKDVLGNVAQIKTLEKSITSDSPSHVYMLSGERGIGKTSLARISAAALGAKPLAIHELNFSNSTSVDDSRDLIEKAKYTPLYGDVSVYICDEFHRLSANGQDALLKLFEETPEHVYFFICTTEPNKVKTAIRSRCIQIHLKLLQRKSIQKLLAKIMIKEGIEHVSDAVLDAIAINTGGSARDAIQLLEQVSLLEKEEDMYAIVDEGIQNDPEIFELYKVLHNADDGWDTISKLLTSLRNNKAAESIRYAILAMADNALLKNGKARSAIIIECFENTFIDSGYPGLTLACYQVYIQK